MGNQSNPPDYHHFTSLCRQHHLKVTPQRIAIYEKLVESQSHPSAEDIYRSLQDDFPNMSFDTVYRTLNTFAEIGITYVVEDYGKSRRFDANSENHHHMHCIRCGTIFDFYDESLDNLNLPKQLQENFKILTRRIVLTGICEKCNDS